MSYPPRTAGHTIRGANATAYPAELAQDPEYAAELADNPAPPTSPSMMRHAGPEPEPEAQL